jgi:hypothetical protein
VHNNHKYTFCIITDDVVLHDSYFKSHGFRFVSDISRDQHANFNQSLNKRVEECANTMRKYRQSLASSSSNNNDQPADTHKQVNGSSPPPVISYKHIKESDEFFEMQDEATGQRFTARASRDKATDKVRSANWLAYCSM